MKLTISGSEFAKIVICFLYSQVTNPQDSVPIVLDKDWAEFVKVLERKGMKSVLLKEYLGTDPLIRVRWNMMKKTFMDVASSGTTYIEIQNEKIPPKEEPSIVSKVGKAIKKAVEYGVAGIAGG